jgi:phosphohistidine swiveling domain-containing protein
MTRDSQPSPPERSRLIWFFDEALPAETDPSATLGGKGASLAAMTRAGLPVPPGFTIVTACCRHFFEHDQTWPPGLDAELRAAMARLESLTGRQFARGKHPLFVSVRSGAAVSMPGMMDTILNCGIHPALAGELGDTPRFWRVWLQFVVSFAQTVSGIEPAAFASAATEPPSAAAWERYRAIYREESGREFPTDPWELLTAGINAVFRSWNSPRALAYRKRHQITGLTGTAVNVQAMFPSRIAGILFSHDPNNLTAERMVIESAWGLGEAVVSGEVTPDRFVVNRNDFRDIETIPGAKHHRVSALDEDAPPDPDAPSLTPEQVDELCRLAMRVESYFGKPMDIEWGWADGGFALLQCRPIRGLDVAEDVEIGRQEEIARLRALAGGQRRFWVAHNLRETLRFPTPLTWDITRRFMSGDGGFGRMYRDFGYQPAPAICRDGFLELICGRIYADPDRVSQLFWDALPLTYDMDAVRADPGQLNRAPTQFRPEKVDETFLVRLPKLVPALLRCARVLKTARPRARRDFERAVLPPWLDYVRQQRNRDLSGLSTAELLGELRARQTRVLEEFGKESLKPGYFGGLALASLESRLSQLLGPTEGKHLTSLLAMGLDGDMTWEQDRLLYRVAHGEAGLDEFLDKFGHRTPGEMELRVPRWREDPSALNPMLQQLRAGPADAMEKRHHHNREKYQRARQRLPELLAHAGGSFLLEEIEADVDDARALLPYRETGKYYLMMGYELLRQVIVELGRRWALGADVFFLRLDELDAFERQDGELRDRIGQRKVRWQSAQRLDLPEVIDSASLDTLGLLPEVSGGVEWRADPIAAGVATGRARIVFDPGAAGDLGEDYILVCPSTDPGWTPLFINARGLVVERGGMLSHGAIVARDFGIPAVVCPQATSLLADGDMVRVDGNHGILRKQEPR